MRVIHGCGVYTEKEGICFECPVITDAVINIGMSAASNHISHNIILSFKGISNLSILSSLNWEYVRVGIAHIYNYSQPSDPV